MKMLKCFASFQRQWGRQNCCCSEVRRFLGALHSQLATALSGIVHTLKSCVISGKSYHLSGYQFSYFSNGNVHSFPICLVVIGVKWHNVQQRALQRQQAIYMQGIIIVLLWQPTLNWKNFIYPVKTYFFPS